MLHNGQLINDTTAAPEKYLDKNRDRFDRDLAVRIAKYKDSIDARHTAVIYEIYGERERFVY